jgi:Flp pilus assembly protein TadG
MTSLVELIFRLARCSSGSALVETAIILPIMISLMVGGVDFGMAFSAHAAVGKSVRDAARYLGSLPPTAACSTWAIANAKKLAVFGKLNPGPDDTALISGWQTDGGTGNNVSVDCSTPSVVIVSAEAPYRTLMLGAVLPRIGTMTLSAQHEEQSIGG